MFTTDKQIKTNKKNFIMALVLLLITNIVTSFTLLTLSKNNLRQQIQQHMLDVSNTAAEMLDGDTIMSITEADIGTPKYDESMAILRKFQTTIGLSYIYCLRHTPDDNFVFIIDPDMDDPADYGEGITITPELRSAARGRATVESKSHTDNWGRFYSAYSPIFDSEGNVAGIIGVDFNAEWYEKIRNRNVTATVILTIIALTMGVFLSFLIMSQNRKKLYEVIVNIRELSREAQRLDQLILDSSVRRLDMLPESETALLRTLAAGEEDSQVGVHSEYDELSEGINSVYKKLSLYLRFVNKEMYIDGTTGVHNKAAYRRAIIALDAEIMAEKANFSVAFFDINGIKKIFTHYGFEAGEKLMFECGKILRLVFGKENVYHVMGDEFIVLLEGASRFDVEDLFKKFDDRIRKYNNEHQMDNNLSVAKGSATYDPERHESYRQVFVEAKRSCDSDKERHYKDIRKA